MPPLAWNCHRRLRDWLLVLGCFAAILGAKVDYIGRFATDLPNWDQWYSEGTEILVPYVRGELTPSAFLKPNNEHRVVPNKLLALLLFVANDPQWDARLECVANALMYAVLAAAFLGFGTRMIDPRWRVVWFAGVVTLFAPAFAWHNTTSGYHTQQTFLLGFSLLTILLLVTQPNLSTGWWVGLACAAAATLSMGSGLLAPLAAGATLVLLSGMRNIPRAMA